jgi:hypothetical protein
MFPSLEPLPTLFCHPASDTTLPECPSSDRLQANLAPAIIPHTLMSIEKMI